MLRTRWRSSHRSLPMLQGIKAARSQIWTYNVQEFTVRRNYWFRSLLPPSRGSACLGCRSISRRRASSPSPCRRRRRLLLPPAAASRPRRRRQGRSSWSAPRTAAATPPSPLSVVVKLNLLYTDGRDDSQLMQVQTRQTICAREIESWSELNLEIVLPLQWRAYI